ncbi:HtaA domain-containing protein [Catenuloplanes japonicus]|uniref:HtaA domain-containing protein n=1 Tax=Catenuloplanes japonicus TaxID=33876 RepID=UPI0006908D1B|nr:HtaA domain-containing protein [Catenuloplanes japonicus]
MALKTGPSRVAYWATALTIGAASVLTAASPASAAPADVAGGKLDWGFKASFRAYVGSGNGNPPIAASNGATIDTDGTFDFPATGGTFDAAAGTATVNYGGTVVFSYPAHFFTITIANPTVVVGANGAGTLLADVDLTGMAEQHLDQAEVATLAVTNPTVDGGAVTWTNLAATLTDAGASAFNGFYAGGTSLDPVTASASASSTPEEPEEPEEPGTPGGGSATQQITAAVTGGALTLAASGTSVALSAATPGATATGSLNPVTVSDLRGTNAGWDLVGQVTDFTSTGGGVIPADNLGWTPTASVVTSSLKAAGGVTAAVSPGSPAAPGAGSGLGASRALCKAAAGSSLGSSTCGAALSLGVPESSAAGSYAAVLTLTLA